MVEGFEEPTMPQGRIEVITGGMFSGKSEELVRRLRRAVIAKRSVLAVKHSADDRYHPENIGCHTGETFKAHPYKTVEGIEKAARGMDVLGIDEAQFFSPSLVGLCIGLADIGVRVIVAGLDMDSEGEPFGPIPHLMAVAESVTKLHAICIVCGGEASFSSHTGSTGVKTGQVEIGATQYEARCRSCRRTTA